MTTSGKMLDKPNSPHTLGFEIDGDLLYGIQLSLTKGKPSLNRRYTATLSNSTNVKQLDIAEGLSKHLVVSTLQTHEVIIRPLEIKLKKEKDIDSVLTFQAEPLLPYPIDEAVIDKIVLGPSSEGFALSLFAARKDHLANHLAAWKALDIEPEVVSCTPAALAAFGNLAAPEASNYFILHIGSTSTICCLIKENKLIAAQSFANGRAKLMTALNKDKESLNEDELDLTNINFSNLDPAKTPNLIEASEQLRLEIVRTVYALTKQGKGVDVGNIILTGNVGSLQQFDIFLSKSLSQPIILPIVPEGFDMDVPLFQAHAVAIGCALTALPKYKNQINFRQKDFAYPHPWRRYKKPLAAYVSLSLIVALLFYTASQSYLGYREDMLKTYYADLLAAIHQPYNDFENDLQGKKGGIVVPLKNLSIEDLFIRLNTLDKRIEATPDLFPLLPNLPRVSDILAWLSTHPALQNSGKSDGAIQLNNFSYLMVKRPEQTKKQEKYQVKIELEFSSPTPKQAREFHDALIAPNDFVDPKGEVKWSSNRGSYKTSFFLKDKTRYLSIE